MWGSNTTDSDSGRSGGVLGRLFGKDDSRTVRSLDGEGYEVFNVGTDESANIFVYKAPERAYFEDEEEYAPTIRPIAEDVSVAPADDAEEETEVAIQYNDPSEVFSNAIRRPAYDAIDFNQVIVKRSPVRAADLRREAPSVDESDFTKIGAMGGALAVAETSTAAAKPVVNPIPRVENPAFENEADLMPFFVPQLSEDSQFLERRGPFSGPLPRQPGGGARPSYVRRIYSFKGASHRLFPWNCSRSSSCWSSCSRSRASGTASSRGSACPG